MPLDDDFKAHYVLDASDEQISTLLRLTERYCVVLQTLRAAPPVTRTLTVEEWTKSVSPYPFSTHG